jgi:23S rRNA (guanosine2251-2'-O)-methyltransferase
MNKERLPPKKQFTKPNRARRDHATSLADGIWLYGVHAIMAALVNPRRKARKVLVSPEMAKAMVGKLPPVSQIVDKAEFERNLPPGAVHQGIAALFPPLPDFTIENLLAMAAKRERAVVVLLDQVTDPHNVGAILRSAAAFGALAVIVQDRHSPQETGVLAKSASGALEIVPILRVVNIARTLSELKEAGFWCVGLDASAKPALAEADLNGKTVLVLGAEGEGMRRLTKENCDFMVRLPMDGEMESLNVSNAAAIALYEWARGLG